MAFDYFTLVELRAMPDLGEPTKYPDAKLSAASDWIVAIIERAVGTSFVARETVETLDGNDQDADGGLKLASPYVLAVTAVTSNGVAFTGPQLAEVKVDAGIAFRLPSFTSFTAWDFGRRNIAITYDAGYSTEPPADVKDAALQGARDRVLRTSGTGISDRTTSITNEFGNVNLAQPGENRPTGLPEVDSVIIGWRDKLDVFGFA